MEKNKSEKDLNFEKRFQSVKGLPKGQFSKYKHMFDSLLKGRHKSKETVTRDKKIEFIQPSSSTSKIVEKNEDIHTPKLSTTSTHSSSLNNIDANIADLSKPLFENDQELYNLMSNFKTNSENGELIFDDTISNKRSILESSYTDDEKTTRLTRNKYLNKYSNRNNTEMNKIFYGVSDETNSLLNSLCLNNKQIAEFFDKPIANNQNSAENNNKNNKPNTHHGYATVKIKNPNEIVIKNDYNDLGSSTLSSPSSTKSQFLYNANGRPRIVYTINNNNNNNTFNIRNSYKAIPIETINININEPDKEEYTEYEINDQKLSQDSLFNKSDDFNSNSASKATTLSSIKSSIDSFYDSSSNLGTHSIKQDPNDQKELKNETFNDVISENDVLIEKIEPKIIIYEKRNSLKNEKLAQPEADLNEKEENFANNLSESGITTESSDKTSLKTTTEDLNDTQSSRSAKIAASTLKSMKKMPAHACETSYFELDDVEFSDESYDPDDDGFNDSDTDDDDEEEEEFDGEYFTNESNRRLSEVPLYKLKLNNLLRKANSENKIPSPAPPKPKRTFEHDIYVNSKTFSKSFTKNNGVETKSNNNNNVVNEHIYEALPSVKEFSEVFDTDEMKPKKSIAKNNDSLMKKLSGSNLSHQRLSTLSSKITLSEPNLTQVGIKKSKNDVSSSNNFFLLWHSTLTKHEIFLDFI